MRKLTFAVSVLVVSAVAAGLLGAAQKGPGKQMVTICHYCDLHNQYNTLVLGVAAAQQHLTEHADDYAGPCR